MSEFEFVSHERYPEDEYTNESVTLCFDKKYRVTIDRNANTVTIYDISDLESPVLISVNEYETKKKSDAEQENLMFPSLRFQTLFENTRGERDL